MKKDTFKTISKPADEILFKERKSKFLGYAFPIISEDDVKPIIAELRKKHHNANHVCYAWQLGTDTIIYRANDDGEPNNSAGMPIYGQIQAFEITNVLVAVVRYFGGTKLGVGGLIQAYKTSAQLTLETSVITEKVLEVMYTIVFHYPDMDKVMRIIKQQNISIHSQKLEMDCLVKILVRRSESEKVFQLFNSIHTIQIKKED